MSRLIDADRLKVDHFAPTSTTNTVNYYYVSMAQIVQAPTVDAVEVVRCKDCKHYVIAQLKKDYTFDKRYSPSVCINGRYAVPKKPDWFCADGKKR